MTQLILIRHPKVASEYREVCYGQNDVPLAMGWEDSLHEALTWIRRSPSQSMPDMIWHSGLQRTELPARWLARQLKLTVAPSPLLKERCFGTWQGQRWDKIPEDEVKQSHAMIEEPETFRPGNGETTKELQSRAVQWLHEAKGLLTTHKTILAVSHSGPITSLAGWVHSLHPRDWTPYYPKPSQFLVLELPT